MTARRKNRSNPVKIQHTTFYCVTCSNDKPMTPFEMRDHVQMVHGFLGKLDGTQLATSFIDGANGFHRQEFLVHLKCGVELNKVWQENEK